jgi:hypothetical protein
MMKHHVLISPAEPFLDPCNAQRSSPNNWREINVHCAVGTLSAYSIQNQKLSSYIWWCIHRYPYASTAYSLITTRLQARGRLGTWSNCSRLINRGYYIPACDNKREVDEGVGGAHGGFNFKWSGECQWSMRQRSRDTHPLIHRPAGLSLLVACDWSRVSLVRLDRSARACVSLCLLPHLLLVIGDQDRSIVDAAASKSFTRTPTLLSSLSFCPLLELFSSAR